MKHVALAVFLLLWGVNFAEAQGRPDLAINQPDSARPYRQYPTLPAFNILEMDSSTIFNTYNIPKGRITAIMFMDPGCKHCQRSIHALLSGMDSVKNVDFYLVSPIHELQRLKDFYNEYHIAEQKNIKLLGRDYEFFFLGYYGVRSLPDIVLYDENKKLIKLHEGEFNATDLYNIIHNR